MIINVIYDESDHDDVIINHDVNRDESDVLIIKLIKYYNHYIQNYYVLYY